MRQDGSEPSAVIGQARAGASGTKPPREVRLCVGDSPPTRTAGRPNRVRRRAAAAAGPPGGTGRLAQLLDSEFWTIERLTALVGVVFLALNFLVLSCASQPTPRLRSLRASNAAQDTLPHADTAAAPPCRRYWLPHPHVHLPHLHMPHLPRLPRRRPRSPSGGQGVKVLPADTAAAADAAVDAGTWRAAVGREVGGRAAVGGEGGGRAPVVSRGGEGGEGRGGDEGGAPAVSADEVSEQRRGEGDATAGLGEGADG
jgi:hypothetical protein